MNWQCKEKQNHRRKSKSTKEQFVFLTKQNKIWSRCRSINNNRNNHIDRGNDRLSVKNGKMTTGQDLIVVGFKDFYMKLSNNHIIETVVRHRK